MKNTRKEKSTSLMARVLRVAAMTAMVFGAGAATLPGCLNRPIEPVEPRTTSTIVERLAQSGVNKIDLLLTIDNSRSMADKQEILKLAVPDLVRALVNPKCVDAEGKPSSLQPDSATQACPVDGTQREFEPIVNIHIGIITSSLGSHGADTCDASQEASLNDLGHLIDRKATDSAEKVPTWNSKGFLVWDPDTNDPTHAPQGETDDSVLVARLAEMVGGAGEVGCGFEAQLESWYRFLVEPDPHETIEINDKGQAVLTGRDDTLLRQRKDFLRPDSLLAIIMLTDENDCSIRDGGQYYIAAQRYVPNSSQKFALPKPRAACATDPASPCCKSCVESPGEGCDTTNDDCSGNLADIDDQLNLRCFDQKRRFGVDFLYPTSRYVSGLTSTTVMDRGGNVVANPLFSDLDPEDDNSNIRDAGLVFLAGIVGVPWQDIARKDANGNPSLINGLDADGRAVGGFQTSSEMATNGTWKTILGDPAKFVPPEDPLMVESVDPRMGSNPVTGDAVQPPSAAEGANPINGHEYTIAQRNDLQYACIFPLATPKDCKGNTSGCDCLTADNDNPLCDPADRQIQKYAKAYPGIRELAVIQGVGTQGIVGSICPEQQTNANEPNFGYRPAVGTIIERLKLALGGQCLPRSLTPNAAGQVSCLILEARKTDSCSCDGNARIFPTEEHKPAVTAAQADPVNANQGWNCFCEITQTTGNALSACQNEVNEPVVDTDGNAAHGWCYVDATTNTGNPELVAGCAENERRLIRFVGDGNAQPGATLLITCSGE